jgi:hypothetical protein
MAKNLVQMLATLGSSKSKPALSDRIVKVTKLEDKIHSTKKRGQ